MANSSIRSLHHDDWRTRPFSPTPSSAILRASSVTSVSGGAVIGVGRTR